jgi:hypothetical protein
MAIIGSCSICGGNVTVPDTWYGINPPVPRCDSCGAIKRTRPVIDMEPVPVAPTYQSPHPVVPLTPYQPFPAQPRPQYDRWVPYTPVTCKLN